MSCPRCNEDAHEEYLNDIYGTVKIGSFEFDAGRIFRELDPIAFSCGMSEIEDNLCEECKKDF